MKIKKLFGFAFTTLIAVNAFALRLPNGDNVRAADTEMEGDSIVTVKIGGENIANITTPIGVLPVAPGTKISFYPTGELKYIEVDAENGPTYTSPIGEFSFKDSEYGRTKTRIAFYKSGSPYMIILKDKANVSFGNYNFDSDQFWFYDSKDDWKVKQTCISYSSRDEKKFTCETKVGKINLTDDIEFFESGAVRSGKLEEGQDVTVMVNGNEVFAQTNQRISFYEDGSVSKFVPDEAILAEQGGVKFTTFFSNGGSSPLYLYKDGKIRMCWCNQILNDVTIGKTIYKFSGWGYLAFDESGKISGLNSKFSAFNDYVIDTFYDDGTSKRELNRPDRDESYCTYYTSYLYGTKNQKAVFSFYSPARRRVCGVDGYENKEAHEVLYVILRGSTQERFEYDIGNYVYSDIAMVYFGNDDKPTSFKVFKVDDLGCYIVDEAGFPIVDEAAGKQKFTFKRTYLR